MNPLEAVMPSYTDAGDPTGRRQVTRSLPRLPSEYRICRTARPALALAHGAIASVIGGHGRVPGATCQLTRFTTWYSPFPVSVPDAANVFHVPPPVTSFPSVSKVPEPVNRILEPSTASAKASPPDWRTNPG